MIRRVHLGRVSHSFQDDPVQLPSSTSVVIQLPRPDCRAAEITRLGPDSCFLYFVVVLSISGGLFRATVRLARTAMEESGLTRWNVAELAVLYTLRVCLDAKDYAAPSAGAI